MLSSVDEILRKPDVQALIENCSRPLVVRAVQMLLEEKRQAILSAPDPGLIDQQAARDLTAAHIKNKISEITRPSLQRVINATGIIVHTNLGRAPLSEDAIREIVAVARNYSNLEFALEQGTRGSRSSHVDAVLKTITGAEAGFVVNNNAAAVLVCLNTLAKKREVIISRGELIEIGGSFRIPEIMEQSGAALVEVGSTNRTRLKDYREAISEQTAVLLKAHTSNYRIVGFTEEVELAELVSLGKEKNIPVMFDMGSGNFIDPSLLGLRDEPTVQEAVTSNVDIITFSGDKLLGGPQAGIIIGREKYVQLIKNNPLSRALRIDKLTLAALEATLKAYDVKPDHITDIPVIRMLMTPAPALKKRAQKVVSAVKKKAPTLALAAVPDTSQVGGGAYPLHDLPTWAISIDPAPLSANEFEYLLRSSAPPVIARISKDKVLLDMRTIFPEEDFLVQKCIAAAAMSQKAPGDT